MDPIQRKPFVGIHFIVCVFGASMCDVVTFEHVIVLSFACTSRQKDPIQRNAFVDIYSLFVFLVCCQTPLYGMLQGIYSNMF